MLESAEPPQPPLGPHDPQIRVKSRSRRLKPDQVDYWEGALQLLFYKLCLKMIEHGSRSTWGPGPPSRSRLWIQKCDFPPIKLPSNMVEAAEPLQPHFAPLTPGLGSRVNVEC